MSFENVKTLPRPNESALPFRCLLAERPKGVVQICHGLAEHSARYQSFAQALAQNGYHAYAHDHRGHGVNIGAHAPKGMFAPRHGYEMVIDDVFSLNTHIREHHPGLPVILFGHSMGGLIALNYLFDHAETVNAAAIWNANFGSFIENKTALTLLYMERMFKGSDVTSAILPKLTFRSWARAIPDHRTAFDWLSHDNRKVDAYIADPLCGFDASVSLWIDIFHMMERGQNAANLAQISKTLPFHLLGGDDDPATAKGASVIRLANRLNRLNFKNINYEILINCRHECLNDYHRETVTKSFLNWLDQKLP